MRNPDTCFGRMLICIDNTPLGATVSRKALLTSVYGYSEHISRSTVDKWRRQLTVLGYLKETKTPGFYKKGKNIPISLTSSQLEKQYSKELGVFYKREAYRTENQPWEF